MADQPDDTLPEVPDDGLGPAMLACTQLQRKFVIASLMIGGQNHSRAAAMAGSKASNPKSLAVSAHGLAHHPRVQAAMLEEASKHLGRMSLVATATVLDVLTNLQTEPKTRLKAAEMILDRTGLHSKSEHNINVTHDVGDRATMLTMIQAKLKVDPKFIEAVPEPIKRLLDLDTSTRELLSAPSAHIVDGEFTELEEHDPDGLD